MLMPNPALSIPREFYVDVDKYQPVGQQFGNYYASLGEWVTLKRKADAEWNESDSITPSPPARPQEPS